MWCLATGGWPQRPPVANNHPAPAEDRAEHHERESEHQEPAVPISQCARMALSGIRQKPLQDLRRIEYSRNTRAWMRARAHKIQSRDRRLVVVPEPG